MSALCKWLCRQWGGAGRVRPSRIFYLKLLRLNQSCFLYPQFRHDVQDNELSGHKLIYERVTRTSPPKSGNPYIIDVSQLTSGSYGYNHPNSAWESYYGSAELSSDPSLNVPGQNRDPYKSVFNSPYFDYRKTHSKVSKKNLTTIFVSGSIHQIKVDCQI